MKLSNGHPHPLDIAELCILIASYLTQHDLAQLCCVCKDFSRHFRPFVWSTVVLKIPASHSMLPSVEALLVNGLLIKHAELVYVRTKTPSYGSERCLAFTLLVVCGSNLTSLKIVDHSDTGKIWEAVMERICPIEGIPLLNGIQVLDISLTYPVLDSSFKRLLTQPEKYPEAAIAFAGVTELGLYGVEPSERYVSEEEERSRAMKGPIKFQFQDLVRLFPRLRKLTLENINLVEPQVVIEAATSQLAAMTTAPLDDYQFHILNFMECGISAKHIVHILRRARNVRSLKIGSGASRIGDEGILFNSLPTLTPLLTEYEQSVVNAPGISTLFRGFPGLTRLYLSAGFQVVDDDIEILAKSCPALQDLTLTYCRSVTYHGVYHILRSCTRLKTLNLDGSPIAWEIFERSPESPSIQSTTTATATATATAKAPPSPAEFMPWACQDTLQHLLLTLSGGNHSLEYVFAARQRLQSLSHLQDLELQCHELPVAMLMDLEHSEGSPPTLYPALEKLALREFNPPLAIDTMAKLARSMPKLKQASHRNYFDSTRHVWRLQELKTLI